MALTIVSGCPRSGTSVCMNVLLKALQNHIILGKKFPQEERYEKLINQGKDESKEQYDFRIYSLNRFGEIEKIEKSLEHAKKMNPNGFWEDGRISVSGIKYENRTRSLIKQIRRNKDKEYLAKIVSQGLLNSDPELLNKVIFMIRNPYEVAKSQEDLVRDGEFIINGEKVNIFENVKVYSPQMFINVTRQAANFFLENSEINYKIIQYENLIYNTEETLNELQDFLPEGNFELAKNVVDKKLYRSRKKENDNDLWTEAEKIYELFKQEKFKEIQNYFKQDTEIDKLNENWFCFRCHARTIQPHCESCFNDKNFRNSLRSQAEKDNIDWKNEPCSYECGFRKDKKLISVEESIKNNHWK